MQSAQTRTRSGWKSDGFTSCSWSGDETAHCGHSVALSRPMLLPPIIKRCVGRIHRRPNEVWRILGARLCNGDLSRHLRPKSSRRRPLKSSSIPKMGPKIIRQVVDPHLTILTIRKNRRQCARMHGHMGDQ